ncbi:MAG: ABC transporter permease [Thainema sp.]
MLYLLQNFGTILTLTWQHLQMTLVTLAVAIAVAVPLSLVIVRYRWLAVPVLGLLGTLYTIPSLALIILLVPLFGLNRLSVIIAMVIYSQVILVRNLTVGLNGISTAVMEAARGMGMNGWQRWWQVQVPLVLPVFLAGIRIAAVVSVAIATIGAKFGAGGLGVLLFEGIAQAGRYDKIWAGAIAVSILAFALNTSLLALEHRVNPARNT